MDFNPKVIVVGGGVSMQRMMALVGNLITAGGGSNEMRDAALAGAGFRRAASMGWSAAKMPFKATRSAVNFVRDSKNNGLGTTIGRRLGFNTSRDYAIERGRVGRGSPTSPVQSQGNGAVNNNAGVASKMIGAGNNNAKNAISGGANPGGNPSGGGNPVANAISGINQGSNMVNNAVNNALNNANNGGKK